MMVRKKYGKASTKNSVASMRLADNVSLKGLAVS